MSRIMARNVAYEREEAITRCLVESGMREILGERFRAASVLHRRVPKAIDSSSDDDQEIYLLETEHSSPSPVTHKKKPRVAKFIEQYLTACKTNVQMLSGEKRQAGRPRKAGHAQILKDEDEECTSVPCFGRGWNIRKIFCDIFKIEDEAVASVVPRSILYFA